MTIILIFIFLLSLILLIILHRKNGFSFFWNNIGKPYIDYRFKPSDYKTIKVYLRSIVIILSGVTAVNLKWGTTAEKDGKTIHLLFGVEYGSIEVYVFIIVLALILLAAWQFYWGYRKSMKEYANRKKTLVVEYYTRIAMDKPWYDYNIIKEALPEDIDPTDSSPQEIIYEGDVESDWEKAAKYLEDSFNSLDGFIRRAKSGHISLFAIAPMPLLVKLGTLFNEKYHVDVYQLHRNPKSWNRLNEQGQEFQVINPTDTSKQPVIAFSLSANIRDRINRLYGDNASIWHVTVDHPNMDMMRSLDQQNKFRKLVRDLLSEISGMSAYDSINIHMAMPASCAIELGRVWMPKAYKSLVLYDYYNNKENETITIENK